MPKVFCKPQDQFFMENEDEGLALRDAISNFKLAKELHRQNLDHKPLPDKINLAQFSRKFIQGQGDLDFQDEDICSGIGYKDYQGYDPTHCTKLKIWRPKSSLLQPIRPGEKPDTWENFERKWRFITQKRVSPMTLALCWDLKPENPRDEPKPPVHIDGSNGCKAPAVFTMVHESKENRQKRSEKHFCDGLRDCVPLFYSTNVLGNDKNYFFERKSAQRISEHQKGQEERSNSGTASKKINNSKPTNQSSKCPIKDDKRDTNCDEKHPCCVEHHKKTMFISKRSNKGVCVSCRMNNFSLNEPKQRAEKKCHRHINKTCVTQKRVSRRIIIFPRPKKPYAAKNYRIDSLAPPFSLQKEKRDDYPEHWRLATVYQHSYKPMKNRKTTLLSTVFK